MKAKFRPWQKAIMKDNINIKFVPKSRSLDLINKKKLRLLRKVYSQRQLKNRNSKKILWITINQRAFYRSIKGEVMIKITYFYGTMKSSKTANLLMSSHNYLEKGIDPILVKPETDNRSGHTMIKSRVGVKEKADYVVVLMVSIIMRFLKEIGKDIILV